MSFISITLLLSENSAILLVRKRKSITLSLLKELLYQRNQILTNKFHSQEPLKAFMIRS